MASNIIKTLEFAIRQRALEPMDWGRNDCCQWVSHLIEIMGGRNPMLGVPRYSSRLEGQRIIGTFFGPSLREGWVRVARNNLWTPKEIMDARDGDVAIVPTARPGGEAVGVVWCGMVVTPTAEHGVCGCPLMQALDVWGVPYGG